MEKKYQESRGGAPSIFSAEGASKAGSRADLASIAPSKVESKAAATKLSKIEEEHNLDEGHIQKMLRQLHANDSDAFDQLIQIAKYVQNNHIDTRKFTTFKQGVIKLQEQKGRRMATEEAVEYAKTLFEELKFIELFVFFCKAPQDGQNTVDKDGTEAGKEKEYARYISIDKITYLNDIVIALPLICKKDKNASTAIYSALNTGAEKRHKIAEMEER